MRIGDNSASIEFQIDGYEFDVSELNQDANWLNCRVTFDSGNLKEEYHRPCILAKELKILRNGAVSVLTKERSYYISDSWNHTSEYLSPVMMRVLKFQQNMPTLPPVFPWKFRNAESIWNREELKEFIDMLEELISLYPEIYI